MTLKDQKEVLFSKLTLQTEKYSHYLTQEHQESRSVMSGETFRKLKLDNKDLDTKNFPTVVGANGTSLGAIGKINYEIEISRKRFKQISLVCENLTRSLILGVDFTKQHAAGVYWTKDNSFVLTIDGETVAETKELHNKAAVSLKKRRKLPPRSCAVVDVDINTTSTKDNLSQMSIALLQTPICTCTIYLQTSQKRPKTQ